MSWQQQQGYGGGYDNYGGYSDASYSTHPPPGQQDDGAAAYTGDNSSFDMLSGSGQYGDQPPQQQYYYDPNVYGGQQPQQPPSQTHQRYPNAGQQQQQQQQQPFGAAAMMMMNPNELISNPLVANMAAQYGQDIVGKGQEELRKNLDRYVSIGQLRYYFAVDTSYVGRKLATLLFPFARGDWSVRYDQQGSDGDGELRPVQPKHDLNAPDLYIPCMAYATYILVVGYVLGLKHEFSPDMLAATASSSLVWLALELAVIYLTIAVMSIKTSLAKWDVVSFSTYKYVGVIVVLVAGLVFQSKAVYYASLSYVSIALAFFLLRTLKLRVEPEVHGMQVHGKRKIYMILLYAGLQPLLMWWLTSYLVPTTAPDDVPASP